LKLRIGLGYDLHRLVPGRKLVLGGVTVPGRLGLAGHSDADVLVHALIDALLGAAGEGDIGRLFPDTDPAFKNARSTDLLALVMADMRRRGLTVLHADAVIVAEKPSVAPLVARMKKILCPLLGVARDGLGIKGKTNEGLGVIGRGRAIACWAVALVRENPRRPKKKAAESTVRKIPRPSAD
jgi:2-C-methyl-D-erythritol 2,4-cyclodiphosphate synthase